MLQRLESTGKEAAVSRPRGVHVAALVDEHLHGVALAVFVVRLVPRARDLTKCVWLGPLFGQSDRVGPRNGFKWFSF